MIPAPPRIAKLPKDQRGYHVPWFVGWVDGVPDFRTANPNRIVDAVTNGRCWTCGETLGVYYAFVVAPMSAINRKTAEPPSHRDCAAYAARVCPFLINPKMARRTTHLPKLGIPPGMPSDVNPGVVLVWVTRAWSVGSDGKRGVLFEVGEPTDLEWLKEGRAATRAEAEAALEESHQRLLKQAEGKDVSEEDHRVLKSWVDGARRLLPAAEV